MKQNLQNATQIRLETEADTDLLARAVAKHLRAGDVVLLSGSLAAGKTTFVRHVATWLGSTDRVSSPTYTLANFYQSPRAQIIHIDAYRLKNAAEFLDLALEEELERSIALIEWGESLADEFDNWIGIDIATLPESETGRLVTLSASGPEMITRVQGILSAYSEADV